MADCQDRKRSHYQVRNATPAQDSGTPLQQDFVDELSMRVQTLQKQNYTLLSQMANAAKTLNGAVIENQILKAELSALDSPPGDMGR